MNKKISSELKVKSRTENLALIRDFISSKAYAAGLSKEEVENIMLAVDEACTNVIKHAYKSFPDGEINILVEQNTKKFSITIEDFGNSFNPDSVPEPNLREYHEEKRIGGLGMYLMKTLMDEVEYISVPGKFNKVKLVKNLNISQNK